MRLDELGKHDLHNAKVTTAAATQPKHTEFSAVVTVGPITAERLTAKLGRTVLPGEQFDLGVIAESYSDPVANIKAKIAQRYRDFKRKRAFN